MYHHSEAPPTEAPDSNVEKQRAIDQESLRLDDTTAAAAAHDWLSEQATLVNQIFQLLGLELKVAAADSAKIVAAGLLMVPLLLLTWVGCCVFISWVVFFLSGSLAIALISFPLLQIAAIVLLKLRISRWSESLKLLHTREHLTQLLQSTPQRAAQ